MATPPTDLAPNPPGRLACGALTCLIPVASPHLAAIDRPQILRHVLGPERCDLSQACNRSGITSDPKLGEHGGLIAILSAERVTRLDYTVQAITMALFFGECACNVW